jgi:hypothetical protein
MEIQMENRKIVHEIKLQKSVIVILAVMAFGIIGITFKGYVTSAEAARGDTSWNPVYIKIVD